MRLFLCLLFWGLIMAQAPAQQFVGHVSLGFNMAQLDGDDLAGFNKLGLVGGIGSSFFLSEKWQLGIELLASQQGAARAATDPLSAAYDNIRINAVELPVLIKLNTWKFRWSAGLSYSAAFHHRMVDFSGQDVSDNFTLQRGSPNILLGGAYFFDEKFGVDVRWTSAVLPRNLYSSISGAQVDQFLSYFLSISSIYLFN